MFVRTEEQIEALGERLGKQIANSKWQIARQRKTKSHKLYAINYKLSATIVALVGELGSGKTTFVRGFARGLGIRSRITSPTFILARRHRISRPIANGQWQIARRSKKKRHKLYVISYKPKYLWHLDLYRLRDASEIFRSHFYEILADADNVIVIEWADRAKATIPKDATWIEFKHHPKGRNVVVKSGKAVKRVK